MNEAIEHDLKCEEIAITTFQDESYRNSDFRESRLQNAKSTYAALLQRHFPQKSSAQIAYNNATQRVENIEKEQTKLERTITDERFKLKAQLTDTSSTTFRRPTKRNVFGSSSQSSDTLSTLLEKFNKFSNEKRRLQLRAKALLGRLFPVTKKLSPHSVTGVALWKKPKENLRNPSPPPAHTELDAGFYKTLG